MKQNTILSPQAFIKKIRKNREMGRLRKNIKRVSERVSQKDIYRE